MSKKSDLVPKLLKKIQPRAPLPKPLKEGTLLEQGLLAVLVRHLSQDKAEATIAALKKIYPDWNEMRVSQNQEVASMLLQGVHRAPASEVAPLLLAVRDAREYLQEVFQKVHGFELEWMREDAPGAAKLVSQMPFLGLSGGSFLLWIASGKELPVTPTLVRVLDRLGLVSKAAAGGKKAREAVAPLVPAGDDLNFVAVFGEVADRWCLVKPICQECPLVDDCPFGRKTYQDWKVQQARLQVQRQRDEAKRLIVEKKEAAKRAREEAREKKRLDAEAKKAARERERQAAIDAKRKAQEVREKLKADVARKKAEALAASAAKKVALAAKALAEKQKKEKAAAAKAARDKAKAASKAAKKSSKPARPARKPARKR